MIISGQITFQDYLKAHWIHNGPIYLILASGIFCFGLLDYFYWTRSLLVFLISVAAAIYLLVAVPLRLRRNFSKYKGLSVPYEIEVTHEHLKYSSSIGSGELKWETFFKWKEGDDQILLYQSNQLFNVIPKHYFESQQQVHEFTTFLEERLGKSA